MRGMRDLVELQEDVAPGGSQAPIYRKIATFPAQINYTGGDETFRGRQLESHIRYVVDVMFNYEWGRLTGNMRMIVHEGPDVGMTLNVEYINHRRASGKDYGTQIYCSETNGDTIGYRQR